MNAPRSDRSRLIVALVLTAWTGAAAQSLSRSPVSLVGLWAFQPGDDLQWAEPSFDDRSWARIRVPGTWRRQGFGDVTGMAWYRVRADAPWPADESIGVTLGKIDSAYEVFAGGRRLGGVGGLPPSPRMEYDRHRTYTIPSSSREPDGSIVLALRVWRNPRKPANAAGPVEGTFELGPIAQLAERAKLAEAQQLALVFLFALVGVYHLTLRAGVAESADYFWFGVLALLTGVYWLFRTQWKYVLLDDFLVLKKIEHAVLWLLPATFLEFVWHFFKSPFPRWVRSAQFLLVAGALTVLLVPGLDVPLALLPIVLVAYLALLAMFFVIVVRRIAAGDREPLVIGAGMLGLGAAIVHDMLVDRAFVANARMGDYGFVFLVLSMTVTLRNRFVRAHRERDALLRDLEVRVETRTRELKDAYRQMEELAMHDALTGLLNRRAIRDRATSELSRARRTGGSLAFAMVDVDRFKAVNDTHGHAAGDDVLKHVARRLSTATRGSDSLGRWGGEEFLVVLAGVTPEQAAAAGERLRKAVAAETATLPDGRHLPITVSVGVRAIVLDASGGHDVLDAAIAEADEALYRAKAAGRNAVMVAGQAAGR